jgi:ribosomal protein L22
VPALETGSVRAQAKWVRTSARKARLVAEHIRGRSVPEARTVLAFTPRAAARELEKVLASAVANAEANHGLSGDELVVQTAVVDEGPTLKRWRARARGRVARIKKRTCHITVTLAQSEAVVTAASPRPKARSPETPKAEEGTREAPKAEERPKRARAAKSKPASAAKPTASTRRRKTESEES